jgi:hypothetical protein
LEKKSKKRYNNRRKCFVAVKRGKTGDGKREDKQGRQTGRAKIIQRNSRIKAVKKGEWRSYHTGELI